MENVTFKDRSTGLLFFGLLTLLLALCTLGLAAVQMLAYLSPEVRQMTQGQSAAAMVVSVLTYLGFAVLLAVLGIGSILKRRWARALLLVGGWYSLAIGVITTVAAAIVLPRIFSIFSAHEEATADGASLSFFVGCMVVVLGLIFVLLPAFYVLFYGRDDVRQTCEKHDVRERWTDRCPLPVLGAAVLFLWSALTYQSTAITYSSTPLFGEALAGWPTVVLSMFASIVCLLIAWALYRMLPWGWWAAVGMLLLGSGIFFLAFRGGRIREVYEQMNLPAEQLQALDAIGFTGPGFTVAMLALFGVLPLLYMLWVRRYFKLEQQPPGGGPYDEIPPPVFEERT